MMIGGRRRVWCPYGQTEDEFMLDQGHRPYSDCVFAATSSAPQKTGEEIVGTCWHVPLGLPYNSSLGHDASILWTGGLGVDA
jgi:hypothetical protein